MKFLDTDDPGFCTSLFLIIQTLDLNGLWHKLVVESLLDYCHLNILEHPIRRHHTYHAHHTHTHLPHTHAYTTHSCVHHTLMHTPHTCPPRHTCSPHTTVKTHTHPFTLSVGQTWNEALRSPYACLAASALWACFASRNFFES